LTVAKGSKMFLHLGNNYVIKTEEIVGIFDIRQKRANVYKNFLKPKLGSKEVINLVDKFEPSSCIVTTDKIILSGLSSLTLQSREKDFMKSSIIKELK
jgi:extracellular matrix regulatory protein B